MAVNKTITCDCCGRECLRWYEIHAFPSAKYSYMNVADMTLTGGAWRGQLCKDCFEKLMYATQKSTEGNDG